MINNMHTNPLSRFFNRLSQLALACLCLSLLCIQTSQAQTLPRVWMETTHGPILLELDDQAAPITTENFLNYVDSGFYDAKIFHRVIDGFVIQSGAYDANLVFYEPTQETIESEANNGLANDPFTIAMGLVGGDVDSAQSQFYINVGSNNYLDEDYTVFGSVIAGQATVSRISKLRTVGEDVPLEVPSIQWAVQTSGYPLMPLHTGSWFNPETSGTGFNIEITNDASTETGPLMIVYWYDFWQGEQLWLTGVGSFEWGDHTLTLELLGAPSPVAGADFQTPPDREAFVPWGTVTIEFSSCSEGEVSYDSPSQGSGVIEITRLSLPVGDSCDSL